MDDLTMVLFWTVLCLKLYLQNQFKAKDSLLCLNADSLMCLHTIILGCAGPVDPVGDDV